MAAPLEWIGFVTSAGGGDPTGVPPAVGEPQDAATEP